MGRRSRKGTFCDAYHRILIRYRVALDQGSTGHMSRG
jgi:hypothetical protein